MKKNLLLTWVLCIWLFSISFGQSTISGRVYNDISGNNSYDPGEELSNVSVWLLDYDAVAPYYRVSPILTASTNASGVYTFSNVSSGNYQVRVMQSAIPSTITRHIFDNDAYPNGLTDLYAVDGSSTYADINFGFAPTSVAPVFSSTRNFNWNSGNNFINQTSQNYNLPSETCGGLTYNPTITWSSDRTNMPGGGYGTNSYPEASNPGSILSQNYPGNNKGGIHPADNTFQLIYGGASYNSINNDRQTTTIQFSNSVIFTKFSIYDIDHADPQVASGRIDHVKVTGYDGATAVMPVLVNPSSAPWNTVSGNNICGLADYPLNGYTTPFNSQNEDHGTINVYFVSKIDKIVIEYEEWAPVMLPGKGINDATPPGLATNEASWSLREAPNAPTGRGVFIGSIDYTFDCITVLPVSLEKFEAIKNGCDVMLSWQTAHEQNLDHFEIEYAADGTNFTTLNKVNAKNISSGSHYRYAVAEIAEKAFYRIKMVDKDGRHQFSNVISVTNCLNDNCWKIAPNPVNKGAEFIATVYLKDNKNKQLSLLMYDANGNKIFQKKQHCNQGENTISVNTNKLTAGIYLVELLDGNNKRIDILRKIIVK